MPRDEAGEGLQPSRVEDFARTLSVLAAGTALAVLLVASGLASTTGLFRIVDLVHGGLLLVGAQLALAAERAGLGFWTGLALAPFLGALLGLALDRFVVRRIRERPVGALLVKTVEGLFGAWLGAGWPLALGLLVVLGVLIFPAGLLGGFLARLARRPG